MYEAAIDTSEQSALKYHICVCVCVRFDKTPNRERIKRTLYRSAHELHFEDR